MSYSESEQSSLTSIAEQERKMERQPLTPPPPKITPADTSKRLMSLLILLSGLGGFLFGYDTGVIAGALLLLKDTFDLSLTWQEVIVSSTTAAAAVSSLVCGVFVVDGVGRRTVIISASVVFAVGALLLAAADDIAVLLIGRLTIGVGIGLSSLTVPVYIAECAPANARGSLVNIFQINIVIGMFISVVIDALFSTNTEDGWRYMFGFSGLPALIQMVGMFFMPESPRWLVSVGRYDEARTVLQLLRGDVDVEKELYDINCSFETDKEIAEGNKGFKAVVNRMMHDTYVLKALLIGCTLQMLQQVIGINTVLYYSATIFRMAGVTNNTTAIWLAAATSMFNVIFTFVSLFLVDRIGRRPALLVSLLGILFSLVLMAVGFKVTSAITPDITMHYNNTHTKYPACSTYSSCRDCVANIHCGFCNLDPSAVSLNTTCLPMDALTLTPETDQPTTCSPESGALWTANVCPSTDVWIIVLGMSLYLASFAIGMGPLPWTINSELYPLWARGTACALSTGTNWFFNFLVSMTFLSLTETFSKSGAFWLYGVLSLMGIGFAYFCVPETKGLALESIEQLFLPGRWPYEPL